MRAVIISFMILGSSLAQSQESCSIVDRIYSDLTYIQRIDSEVSQTLDPSEWLDDNIYKGSAALTISSGTLTGIASLMAERDAVKYSNIAENFLKTKKTPSYIPHIGAVDALSHSKNLKNFAKLTQKSSVVFTLTGSLLLYIAYKHDEKSKLNEVLSLDLNTNEKRNNICKKIEKDEEARITYKDIALNLYALRSILEEKVNNIDTSKMTNNDRSSIKQIIKSNKRHLSSKIVIN